ncbi:hypothetical protein H9Q74_009704 [Fusarium xylarioides]|nr:hypothetical protein H9Q71_010198 [Fusarium xylarioides]KAG5819043.1 hypothetical protein H9Q74_009704 [Fusarium xylarioides]
MPKRLQANIVRHERETREKVFDRIQRQNVNKPRDFFSYMLQDDHTDIDHLAEQAKILLLDGSETTATLLAGATYLLLKTPEAFSELRREVRSSFSSVDEIGRASVNELTYLRAVVEESLRLFPPVPLGLPRTSPGAMIDGYFVPFGTEVSVDNFAMSHDPLYFPDPDRFDPRRWIGKAARKSLDASRPFSLGPRACLGIHLANLEIRMVIAMMVYAFDWELVDKKLDWFQRIRLMTFWHKPPLLVKFHPRNDSHVE